MLSEVRSMELVCGLCCIAGASRGVGQKAIFTSLTFDAQDHFKEVEASSHMTK